MSNRSPDTLSQSAFAELLSRYLNGDADGGQISLLNQQLAGSPDSRDTFAHFARLHGRLNERGVKFRGARDAENDLLIEPAPPATSLDDAMILPAIRVDDTAEYQAEDLLTAPAISPSIHPRSIRRADSSVHAPSRFKFRRVAAILLPLGALITALWFLHNRHPSVAVLMATNNAQWNGKQCSPGDGLPLGTSWQLTAGFAELRFTKGASVLVQAPAEIIFRSDRELFLSSGKVFARVEEGGFVVSTPKATVTDLGTEFGVDVSSPDHCDVAVFKGKVRVDAADTPTNENDGANPRASLILVQGEAASVASASITPEPSLAISQSFTRSLKSAVTSLDVVDLIAGGDGTTLRDDSGIDPSTGNAGKLLVTGQPARSDHEYKRVFGLPVVDGCFVPNGSQGANQIDSADHLFQFPATDGGSFTYIWAGPSMHSVIPSIVAGTDYAVGGHRPLFMHPNKGLTFDLDAIRHLYPGRLLTGFRASVGNSFDPASPGHAGWHPEANAYVLVDGAVRFERTVPEFQNGILPMNVPISEGDRYLTLATTAGGAHAHFDWVLIVDPIFSVGDR